jgi:hypothetical protein
MAIRLATIGPINDRRDIGAIDVQFLEVAIRAAIELASDLRALGLLATMLGVSHSGAMQDDSEIIEETTLTLKGNSGHFFLLSLVNSKHLVF